MSVRRFLNKTVLKATPYTIVKTDPLLKHHPGSELHVDVEFIVAHRLMQTDDFFFIQVGANDGRGNDPVYPLVKKYHVRGLVLEPLPDIFAALQRTYAGEEQIICVNKAIHAELKEMTLYRIADNANQEDLPEYASRIASFEKQVIEKHKKRIPNFDEVLTQETVQCVTLDELMAAYRVKRVDWLQVDTEGYDYEVIKMLDFTTIQPAIIRYEHKHLSPHDHASCLNDLIDNGYKIFATDTDITAYNPFVSSCKANAG